jgi:hypothetical protein
MIESKTPKALNKTLLEKDLNRYLTLSGSWRARMEKEEELLSNGWKRRSESRHFLQKDENYVFNASLSLS